MGYIALTKLDILKAELWQRNDDEESDSRFLDDKNEKVSIMMMEVLTCKLGMQIGPSTFEILPAIMLKHHRMSNIVHLRL